MNAASSTEDRRRNSGILHQVVLAEVLAALFGMLVGLVIQARLQSDSLNPQPVVVVLHFEVSTTVPAPNQTMTISDQELAWSAPKDQGDKESKNGNLIQSIPLGKHGHVDVSRRERRSPTPKTIARMEWVMTFQFKRPGDSAHLKWEFSPRGATSIAANYQIGSGNRKTLRASTPPQTIKLYVRPDGVELGPTFTPEETK